MLEGSTALARLEISEFFILCGHQAYKMHIKSITVVVHNDDRVEITHGQFMNKGIKIDMTQLESGMTFLQVQSSMTMKEKLRQVQSVICLNWRSR